MTFLLLFSIFVLSNDRPVKGAIISCAEVSAYNVEEGISEMGGEWSPTDANGRMIFTTEEGTIHCKIRKEGFLEWKGTLTFSKEKPRQYVQIERE